MQSKVQWSTVAIVAILVAAYVALKLAGHDVPSWLGDVLGAVGIVIAGAARALVTQHPVPEVPRSERDTDPEITSPGGR